MKQLRSHHFCLKGELLQLEDVLVDGTDFHIVEDESDDRANENNDEEQADSAHGCDRWGLSLDRNEILEVFEILEIVAFSLSRLIC